MLTTAVAALAMAAPSIASADDLTPPTITVSAPTEGQTFEAGPGTVSTAFMCTDEDGASDVATCEGPSSIDTSVRGNQTLIFTATDNAGNRTEKDVNYSVVDTVAPGITITLPAPGQHFPYQSSVVPEYSCSDTGGVGLCSGFETLFTDKPGPQTYTVMAYDYQGNMSQKSVDYFVDPPGPGYREQAVAKAAASAVTLSRSAVAKLRSSRLKATLSVKAPSGSTTSVRVTAHVGGRDVVVANGRGKATLADRVSITLRPASQRAKQILRGSSRLSMHVFVKVTDVFDEFNTSRNKVYSVGPSRR
jgi:hypothetical protein